ELFNFGIDMVPRPMLRCYRVDPSGRMSHIGKVDLAEPVFNHDFALTEKHMVFVIDPIGIAKRSLPEVLLGIKSYDQALRFDGSQGTTIALVPRDGGTARVLQTEALMHFHVNNAYEDGGDTVVDLVRWDRSWEDFNESLRSYRPEDADARGDWEFGGYLMRLRITAGGRVLREQLSDTPGEFPQFDWRLGCREHRYSYMAAREGHAEEANAVAKIDHRTGEERLHVLPDAHAVSEPIFVPRDADAEEDDGWLLAVAYDGTTHRSRLLVLDAADPRRDPVFTGHLRHHVPQSFHGTFVRRVARSSIA
ncbi:MAG: carotenoid oxygenase family protein, partial [Solirubrobacteraceae bacterium]|nr:carotenoid oxygenase family protein [Solirubrobacteraceae bacterium]